MTKRPRSHRLESESRTALRAIFPSAWTIQDIVHDYGLDERVEVFDAQGIATGLVFYVQLKATDISDLRRALRVRVDLEHFEYWNRLQAPVLVALWHAPTKRLFWRWAHHHCPYADLNTHQVKPDGSVRPSATMRFSARGLWNAADAGALVEEVRYLQKLHAGNLHLPQVVGVTVHEADPLPTQQFESTIARFEREISPTHIRFHSGFETPGRAHLYISSKKFQLRLGRLNFSMAATKERSISDFQATLSVEVASALGLALCISSSGAAGAELLEQYGTKSKYLRMSTDSRMPPLLVLAITRSGRYDAACHLIESWLLSDDSQVVLDAKKLAFQLYSFYGRMSPNDLATFESILARIAPSDALQELLFQTAERFLNGGLYGDALRTLEKLIEKAGGVDKASVATLRSSAIAELSLGQFARAKAKLVAILERDRTDISSELLLARCCLLMGDYRAALTIYETAADPSRAGEIQVGRAVLTVIAELACDCQLRRPDEAETISREIQGSESDEEIIQRFARCVAVDAVSPNTWRLLSTITFRKNMHPLAAFLGMVMAFLAETDVDWFAIAAVAALDQGQTSIFANVVEYAVENFFERFIEAFSKIAPWSSDECSRLVKFIKAIKDLKTAGLAISFDVAASSGKNGLPVITFHGVDHVPPRRNAPPSIEQLFVEAIQTIKSREGEKSENNACD
jgi:tetratricopeptide (TPR) repeat protein